MKLIFDGTKNVSYSDAANFHWCYFKTLVHFCDKLLAWTDGKVNKWLCSIGYEEEAALFSSKLYIHERPLRL